MKGEIKVYPICCTSAYCGTGGDACKTCKNYPKLEKFRKWVKEYNAFREDETWCPLVYTARR